MGKNKLLINVFDMLKNRATEQQVCELLCDSSKQ